MFGFQFCPKLQDKHCRRTMTVTMTMNMTEKIRYMPPPLASIDIIISVKSLLPETTMSNDAKTPNGLNLGIGCQLKKKEIIPLCTAFKLTT